MITIPGQLAIKTIHGKNGDFNVGRLATSIGEFVIKNAELDQYDEGKYEGDFVIAALQGPHQHLVRPTKENPQLGYGFGWLSNFKPEESVVLHHQLVRRIIADLSAAELIDAQRVFLLGFSQSCALNYRFAFTHSNILRGVIGICGGLPGDWETSELYQPTPAAVFHLAGTRDEYYGPARVENYAAQLRTRARDVEFRSYDAGHEISPAMREDIRAWLTFKSEV